MEFDLLDGRSFSQQFIADTSSIIFNQAAIEAMGLQDPVGKTIKLHGQTREIIGVVRDFNFQSLHTEVEPLFMLYNEGGTWNVMIRLEENNKQETLQKISAFYSTFNPGFTFDYKFQDDEYALQYRAEQRVATLAGYFAVFAILISCLGLYGLASHTTERRFKEMGIRKALGSSASNILILLSRDFIKLVLFGIGLGLPISYWLMNQWLLRFAFHIDLTIWYFLVAAIIALTIAWLAVVSKAWSAARVNPVDCIRME
ncbi:MAG: FtsX-like permease family protein [Cytophagales bacterium]|nr:FtsX-like permease family protein [Cytophagales bacterium]